jgi:hypothetical protein
MGERLCGDAMPGRRRVHPDGAVPGSWDVRDVAALETALADALRGDFDPEAEQRAVAAFRAARSLGVDRARTRRRNDWRMPAERRSGRRVKTTFAAVFASLALGGVAVAAIGSAGSGSSAEGAGAGRVTASPSSVAPGRVGGEDGGNPSPSSGVPRATGGPARAQDTEAHCRAYEQVRDRGKVLDATAWQRLVAAAGGKDKVAAYCSEKLTQATATPDKPGSTGKPGGGAADNGKGTAGSTGSSGNGGTSGNGGSSGNGTSGAGTSGDASGGTGNAAGHGRSGGKHQ